MGDVLSTLGAVAAGLVIRFTGLDWVDPLVSILIGFLIVWNAWGIIRESAGILMEATPADIDMDVMLNDIQSVEGVHGVHDLHVWSISKSLRTLSAHVLTDDIAVSEGAKIQTVLNALLAQKYDISHATLQLECVDCVPSDLFCDITNNQNHIH